MKALMALGFAIHLAAILSMARVHFATNRTRGIPALTPPALNLTSRVVLIIVDGMGLDVSLAPSLDSHGHDDGGAIRPDPTHLRR